MAINPVSYTLPITNRTLNYVGKGNWASDGILNAYLDDMRFYSFALTQSQIMNVMMLNETSTNIDNCFATTTTSTTTLTTTSTATIG